MARRDLTSETAEDKFNVEAEAKRRGIQPYQVRATQAVDDRLMRDIVNDFRRGVPQSASMFPPKREPPKPKGTGWVDAEPIKSPPGVAWVDQLCDAQDRLDRAHAVRVRDDLAQVEMSERARRRVPSDYNPFDRNLIGPGSDDE